MPVLQPYATHRTVFERFTVWPEGFDTIRDGEIILQYGLVANQTKDG